MVKDATPVTTKKKKTEVSADEEIYRKVIEFENKESSQRTTKEDADIYFNTCSDIRDLLSDIFKSKLTNEADAKKDVEARESCTKACVNVVGLKKINRLIKFRIHKSREDLKTGKQKVDSTHLQLQNLLYELAHVHSEWNKCRQYKSKDEDIELISIEKFMLDAPEAITKAFVILDDSDTYLHSLHLARLEHELSQRVELSRACAQKEDRKRDLAAAIVLKRDRLDGLGPQLAAVLEATRPLQGILGLPVERTRAEYKLAALLPDGLYMLYGSGSSYNTVYKSGIELEIIGDPDLAQQYTDKQHLTSTASAASHLDTFDSDDDQDYDTLQRDDLEDVHSAATNSATKQTSAAVESVSSGGGNKGGKSSSRRHNRKASTHHEGRGGTGGGGTGGSGALSAEEVKKREMLEAHPLSVLLTVKGTTGPTVKISFKYCPNLHIVTVLCDVTPPGHIAGTTARDVLHGDQLLNELIGIDDHGTTSPNPNTHFQLSRVGCGSFKSLVGQLGHAYVWAQNMCGLEFPQTKKCNSSLSLTSVETVINALKHRIKTRTKLAEQLKDLDANTIPHLPDELQIPKNCVSTLSKWAGITFQTFCLENDRALALLEAEIITQNSMYYKLIISRPKASLQAFVIIANNYPKKVPIFLLKLQKSDVVSSASNNEDIRDLERAVNVECLEDIDPKLNVNILALQIHYLCAYFDVYLETADGNQNFEQSSIYFKRVGARNRRKPFRFRKVGSGIFTQ